MKTIFFVFLVCIGGMNLPAQNKHVDSLLAVLVTAKDDTGKVNTLNALSERYQQLASYPEAKKYAEEALGLAEKLEYKKGVATAFMSIGNIYYRQSNYPESMKNYLATLKISEETGDKKGIAAAYSNIGIIYQVQRKYTEAQNNHLAALKIRKEIGDKQGIAISYNNIGIFYQNQGNYSEALKSYSASMKIKEEIGDKPGIATAYNNIGNIFRLQSNYPEALKSYSASLKIKEEIGDKPGLASSYNNIGIIYQNQARYPEALKNYTTALKLREEMGNPSGMASAYNNIGTIHWYLGNYPEALKNFLTALKIREEIGEKEGIASSYNSIGGFYYEQGNYVEALKNYSVYQKINSETGNKRGAANAYNNIGTIYSNQGKAHPDPSQREVFFQEALVNYQASLKIKNEIGDKRGAAVSYNNIGIIYAEQGKNQPGFIHREYLFNEAMKNYQASLKIREEIGDKQGISSVYINLGELNMELKRYAEARKLLDHALSLSKDFGSIKNIRIAYKSLATLDSSMGNFPQALANYKLYSEYKDSAINEDYNKQIVQMKEQFESEKKDNEIQQLTSENQKLESEKQINTLLLKTRQDSLSIVQAEKEKAQLEIEKSYALNLFNLQRIDLLSNEKEIQQLQIEKAEADFAAHKAEAGKNQERLLVLGKEKDIQTLQLKRQKQAKSYFIGGVVLLALLSFFIYRNYRNQRKAGKLAAELSKKQMKELELQSLRAQLNPHFMFNSLNAIQELILLNENDKSHSYLARFAKLLRMLLENTESPFVKLNKEIDFLELYLSLENLRIPDLQYFIQVDPSVNTGETLIPNMVLQPYIENALWHGLSHKQGDRKLLLHIYKQNGDVQYEIEDNGVGRKKAAEIKSLFRKEHKSKGMELLQKRFKLLNEEYGSEINTEISDVMNNGEVGGTRVQIKVPSTLTETINKLPS